MELKQLEKENSNELKIEESYYAEAEELGLEGDNLLVNKVIRKIKIVSDKDRRLKLLIGILHNYDSYIYSGQYEKAYEMLDKDYTDTFGMSFELFKKLYSRKSRKDYVISSIDEKGLDKYVITRINMNGNNSYTPERLSIIKNQNDGKYFITLNGLSEKVIVDMEIESQSIKLNIIERYHIGDLVAYKILITNNSYKPLILKGTPDSIYGSFNKQNVTHKILNMQKTDFGEEYTVLQGQSKLLIVEFNTKNNLDIIGFKTLDDELIEFNLIN
jgi:uncharacterized protein (UPF0262 family)